MNIRRESYRLKEKRHAGTAASRRGRRTGDPVTLSRVDARREFLLKGHQF
jgi:hypothetical protein